MAYSLSNCALCGRENFAPLLKARDFNYGNPGEYSLAQCTQCSLAFLDPMYDEVELATFYPKEYYAFADRFSETPRSPFRRAVRKILGLSEHLTKDPTFDRPGRMLDVGCGSGWFLSKMKAKGWDVRGVKPSESAARLGRTKEGLNIFVGSLLQAAFPPESFDYIRFNHSFEHMSDPNAILAETHRVLARNGKVMIGVPNRDSLNARLFGSYWHHLALPLHTFGYSTRTISRMLEKHFFKVERVVFNTDSNGLHLSLQMYMNRNAESLSVDGRITRNRIARILCTWGAGLENLLRIADVVEVTATKR